MKRLICIFSICACLCSCEWLEKWFGPASDGDDSYLSIELLNDEIVDISGVGTGESLDGLMFVLDLNNLEFNSDAALLLTKGQTLEANTGASGWATFQVGESVKEGDTKLIVKVSGTKRASELEFSIPIKKAWLNILDKEANYDDANDALTVSGKLGEASAEHPVTPNIVMDSKDEMYFTASGAESAMDVDVAFNLVNLKFTKAGADALNANKANLKNIQGIVSENVPAWLNIAVKECPATGGNRVVLNFSGNPNESGTHSFDIVFDNNWLAKTSSGVSDLKANQFQFLFTLKSDRPELESYGILPSSSRIKLTSAGESVSSTSIFVLNNMAFSSAAAEALTKDKNLDSLGIISIKDGDRYSNNIPDWITFKVAEGIKSGDDRVKIDVTAVPPSTDDVEFKIVMRKEWLRRARTTVKEITDDCELSVVLSRKKGTHDCDAVSTALPAVPVKDAGTGKSGVISDSNAIEIVANTTTTLPESAKGKELYTIVVNYPTGDYDGSQNADFTLKGTGNVSKVSLLGHNLSSKAAPVGESSWNDMWDLNAIGAENAKTTGRYWFTDTNNLIKYYVTDGSSATHANGRIRSAWNGVGVCTGIRVNSDYWDSLKNSLLNGSLKDKDMLRGEREAFGLGEYDKDLTSYFYVIFCDFGDDSASVSGKAYSGTAGMYYSTHIRPGSRSNEADIFYVNARFVEAMAQSLYNRDPKKDLDDIMSAVAAETVNTLLHEYMHYLMDSNHLLKAENEYSDNLDDVTETIYSPNGSVPATLEGNVMMYSAINFGSLFWLEGTANYAPYRMIGEVDTSAVRSWLGSMNSWRPSINRQDEDLSNGGDSYAVYGAGGLFFSYIGEAYGKNTVNRFHSWRDSGRDLLDVANSVSGNADAKIAAVKDNIGNINNITKGVMNERFKDVYLNFLYQCMSSLDDSKNSSGEYDFGSTVIKGCVNELEAPVDWGFADQLKYQLNSGSLKRNVISYSGVGNGASASDLPELSFVIHKWQGVPEGFQLNVSKGNVKCYAVWL